MNRKRTALMLSALILPGLGQLYLGRKVVGAVLIMAVNLLLLATMVLIVRGLAPLLLTKASTGAMNPADVSGVLKGFSSTGIWLAAAFILLWAYSVVDIIKAPDDPSPEHGHGD